MAVRVSTLRCHQVTGVVLLLALLSVVRSTGAELAAGASAASPLSVAVSSNEAQRPPREIEMDAWLRRLVGRYRVEGLGEPLDAPAGVSVPAMADCTAIGAGAGVHCIIGWAIPAEGWGAQSNTGGQSAEVPSSEARITRILSMYQFGLDPAASRIRFMRAESMGMVMEGSGTLSNGTMRSRMRCPDSASHPPCESVVVIAPSSDDQVITMRLYITSGQMQYMPTSQFVWHRVRHESGVIEPGTALEIIQPSARGYPTPVRPTSRSGRGPR